MKKFKFILILLMLFCNVYLSIGQNFNVNEVVINISDSGMININIPENNSVGYVKRTIELNRIITRNNVKCVVNKSKISIRGKSNKSKRSGTPGKYEIIVSCNINGVITTEKEYFEIK